MSVARLARFVSGVDLVHSMKFAMSFYSKELSDTVFSIPTRYENMMLLGVGAQGTVW